ncbi:MAG TPA: 4-phosphoerythronate dehydrogenase [Kiritimatiellia bacterium]|nr:4-phosphoerythronate dehydrogenase [Kiritimatiellia bacterium]
MKIVCAASVLHAREAFSGLGDVLLVPDREICRAHLQDADVLIVRSKTRVGPELLEGTPVGFVATATAGADHFDVPWLNRAGLAWTAAPGCNANSVAEYVAAALALLARKRAALLPGKTLGLVGCGQVGSRVAQKAALLGLRVLRNDPPLALKSGSADYLPLETILPQADVLTLHVPLESGGPFPTRHLADCRLFEKLKPGAWFINSSRGAVTDSDSLLCALDHHLLAACALDVWEKEPDLPEALKRAVDFLTPHVAGYSLEGLLNGTLHCYRELCHYLEVEPTWTPDPRLLPPAPFVEIDAAHRADDDVLAELLAAGCPIPEDDRAWRAEMTTDDPAELRRRFDRFRKNYQSRREFAAIRVHLSHASSALLETAAAFGFQVCAHQP